MKAIGQLILFAILSVPLFGCGGGNGSSQNAPTITLTGDNPQILEVGQAYVELGATATDDKDGDLTASITIDASSIDSSNPGTYQVTYDVSDSSDNAAATAVRTVIYEDRTPPEISLLGNNPQVITQGNPYVELGATATDNVDGDLTSAIIIDDSAVDAGTVGSYDVTYDVQDSSGNSAATMVRTVNVEETPAAKTWYRDFDRDGYSNGATQVSVARPPDHYEDFELTAISGDCDDDDASLNPGADDIDADGIDQDCNGFETSGPEEVVFDWSTDRCDDLDIPDFPARAFRDNSGQVQLISSHMTVRRFLGPDLDHLSHDCIVVMTSDYDPDPGMFNDVEWIGATYTEDGETIYAVLHNEYEGWTHPGQCRTSAWDANCWYNGLTLAISEDAGRSYYHPVAPPLHHIAGAPWQYDQTHGPRGIFHPSSLLKRTDGYFYAMVQRVGGEAPDDHEQWACLIRTPDLGNPDAWRFWDGSGFEGRFVNPYSDAVTNPADHDCQPIDRTDISDMTQSLTYSEYLGKYVLVGTSTSVDGSKHGFFVSFSDNLIDWSPRELLLERALPWTVQSADEVHYLYPSLLDSESSARSFDIVGKTAYVYYTRNNREPGDLDRDMLRVSVEFFRH